MGTLGPFANDNGLSVVLTGNGRKNTKLYDLWSTEKCSAVIGPKSHEPPLHWLDLQLHGIFVVIREIPLAHPNCELRRRKAEI